jgi:cell division protein FtsX
MTGFVAIMWAVWGVLVVVMLALKIYAGRLSRNEENQLVLDSAFDNLKTEQAAIADSIHKIEPVRKASLWLVVAATVFVIGYYVMDVVNQFK